MRKEWITEYIANKQKIDSLKEQKRKLPKVKDVVKGSDEAYPYIKRAVTINGVDRKKADQIEKDLQECRSKCEAAERFISSAKNSKIQNILRWKYIDGYSWVDIARMLGTDEDAPRKMAKRYLDRQC